MSESNNMCTAIGCREGLYPHQEPNKCPECKKNLLCKDCAKNPGICGKCHIKKLDRLDGHGSNVGN